jgi:hypothetical protein
MNSSSFSPAVDNAATAAPAQRTRDQIEDRFKWDLSHVFPDWDAWQRGYDELDRAIGLPCGIGRSDAAEAERSRSPYQDVVDYHYETSPIRLFSQLAREVLSQIAEHAR